MAVAATALASSVEFPLGSEVVQVQYNLNRSLEVHVRATGDTHQALVVFACVEAFRVMDERDLFWFWLTCSTPNGWLFEISSGGWLSEEADHGTLLPLLQDIHEFLITGEDACVCVLSVQPPIVTIEPVL
jgi:hypothetical protein